ncbi:phosphoribosylaminoimidazolesuccinocarboxamide synthase [Hugenholtzia roseola]|uniref:phosphoribosylaminoimidazolesuccinocarboxamide synthase n=1 Tax=Hugenholtzia roseola TaxID=1002 RepID=UPI0003FD2F58|nr:phosphoribosylaminoimidazolesuccinocarboxamide synthase [Hugenholtzia roseola]
MTPTPAATVNQTHFQIAGQTNFYRGKVREVYYFGNQLALIASDRISAFDVILPRTIPHKGQILNQIAVYFLKNTADIVPNWLEKQIHPQVSVGKAAQPLPIEVVVRGYLAGHAWRTYASGKRELCGETLPEGLKQNDKLPTPIITPSTKAQEGHDEDISKAEILAQGLVSPQDYAQIEKYALALFERGSQMAAERGLILVDTKYEFGKYQDEAGNSQIILIDEVHTPDSSRYFYAEGYEQRQEKGEKQKQLSKEFVREWLIENGFQGRAGESVPPMTDAIVLHISQRYQELYEQVVGEKFVPAAGENLLLDIETALRSYFEQK